MAAKFMAILRSLLNSLGLDASRTDEDDAEPSLIAIMSGGVITATPELLLLVV
jgi:hypothetical protein